ncbi:hypothetical protein W02_17100 [Nitrospira sp. KM1]|nr:hypothetical protein W02_17100 [Nitrospira sp. KM1]
MSKDKIAFTAQVVDGGKHFTPRELWKTIEQHLEGAWALLEQI